MELWVRVVGVRVLGFGLGVQRDAQVKLLMNFANSFEFRLFDGSLVTCGIPKPKTRPQRPSCPKPLSTE